MQPKNSSLEFDVQRITRVHFVYVGIYILSIVAFDSWNLISHQGIVWRWQAASALLAINAVCWYLAKSKLRGRLPYKLVALALILADIAFAALNVNWERGMASKSVILFMVPILLSAVLQSRRAILATTTLCTAMCSYVLVNYFHLHYGEGFKVELYGTLLLYCGIFYVTAMMLIVIRQPQKK